MYVSLVISLLFLTSRQVGQNIAMKCAVNRCCNYVCW